VFTLQVCASRAPVDHEEGAALDEGLAQHVLGPPVARDDRVPVPRVPRQLCSASRFAVAAPVQQRADAWRCNDHRGAQARDARVFEVPSGEPEFCFSRAAAAPQALQSGRASQDTCKSVSQLCCFSSHAKVHASVMFRSSDSVRVSPTSREKPCGEDSVRASNILQNMIFLFIKSYSQKFSNNLLKKGSYVKSPQCSDALPAGRNICNELRILIVVGFVDVSWSGVVSKCDDHSQELVVYELQGQSLASVAQYREASAWFVTVVVLPRQRSRAARQPDRQQRGDRLCEKIDQVAVHRDRQLVQHLFEVAARRSAC